MKEEMNSLKENQTWTLIDLPQDKKVIKTKWIFKTKKDNSGKIVRHKARLVAKGYSLSKDTESTMKKLSLL